MRAILCSNIVEYQYPTHNSTYGTYWCTVGKKKNIDCILKYKICSYGFIEPSQSQSRAFSSSFSIFFFFLLLVPLSLVTLSITIVKLVLSVFGWCADDTKFNDVPSKYHTHRNEWLICSNFNDRINLVD